jgi:hypothetical protein
MPLTTFPVRRSVACQSVSLSGTQSKAGRHMLLDRQGMGHHSTSVHRDTTTGAHAALSIQSLDSSISHSIQTRGDTPNVS